MWYKIDLLKFGLLLLPPFLRKKRLFAFLSVLLFPFQELMSRLDGYRKECDDKLNVNGQVIYIDKALNDYFLLPYKDIYITEKSLDDIAPVVYLFNEAEPAVYFFDDDSRNVTYLTDGDVNASMEFVVNVPSYLEGQLDEIRNLVEFNKPAGRIYKLTVYPYE